MSTIGLILTEYSGVIPDIMFFTHTNAKRIVSGERLIEAPDLVSEILSAGSESLRCDRVAKRQLYGKHGVLEYWLIGRDRQALEIFRLRGDSLELANTLQGEEELSTPVLPGFLCKASQIFLLPQF